MEAPELARSGLAKLTFTAFADGALETDGAAGVPRRVVERMAAALDARLGRPYEACAVRQTEVAWSVGARTSRGDAFELPAGFPASSLEVVVTPDGQRTISADDGDIPAALLPLYADAVAELERRGRGRFEAFVARADKVAEERWNVTVDPL